MLKRMIILVSISLFALSLLTGDEQPVKDQSLPMTFNFLPEAKYKIIEKSNFSKRENGKYLGYIYREVRGMLTMISADADKRTYEGQYYVLEELKHEDRLLAPKIDKAVPARFEVLKDGTYKVAPDQIYPWLRSFPVFPGKAVKKGESWTAFGTRIVDPTREETYTRVKFYCEYTYLGEADYMGTKAHSIKAQYAMRYKRGDDIYGDAHLSSISGKHVVTIMIATGLNSPVFMKDQMEEEYLYDDKRTLVFSGHILTWFNDIVRLDKQELVKIVRNDLDTSKIPDVIVTERPDGVSLNLQQLHFVTNEAQLLADEKTRLDALAAILKTIPKRTFLVVGHTTDIGPKDFLKDLSVKRAKAIVDALVVRGIPADRLMYEGRGPDEPLAPNDTEENKTKNRRVEVIVLED